MEFTLAEGENFSTDCPTLVLPGLSIGNVGQLAVDLLISSSGAKRVAYLDEPSVLPCVGNDAYGPDPEGVLALPLEVYESHPHALSLIQQRSPIAKGMMIEFAKHMADLLLSIGKKHAIVLSSLDSGRIKNIVAPSDMQVHYISSTRDDGTDGDCELLGFKRLEGYNPTQRRWKYLIELAEGKPFEEDELNNDDELVHDDYYSSLPFAALFSCFKAKGLKVTCLLRYCSEGDNIPDSFQLAEAVCKLLKLTPGGLSGHDQGGWVIPLSWKTVYGPPPDMSLF